MTDHERTFSADDFDKLCAALDRLAASLRVEHREEEMVAVVDAVSVLRTWHDGLVKLSTSIVVDPKDGVEGFTRRTQIEASSWLKLRARRHL